MLGDKATKKRIAGYNFLVYLGAFRIYCSKVSGVENVLDTQTFAEGGVNDRVFTMDANVPHTEKNLILENGLSLDSNPVDYLMFTGYRPAIDLLVFVLDANRNPKFFYSFSGCYVKSISYSDLDASRSELIMKKMTISYESMLKVPIPL